MRRLVAALLVLATLLCAADKKRKPPKGSDVEVIEMKAQRNQGQILVDGRFRAGGTKAIKRLTLYFDFLDTDGGVLTTKRYDYEDEAVEPGSETDFRLYLPDPVRAVTFQLRAEASDGKELKVTKGGPLPVE